MLIVLKNNAKGVTYNLFESDEIKREVAIKNYKKLKKNLEIVFKKHESGNKKNSFYWELGKQISDFIITMEVSSQRFIADIIESANSIFHEINPQFANSDHTRGRNMAYYFYLLSKYPKNLVEKTSWSFWSYFFQLKYFRVMNEMHEFLASKESLDEFKEGFRRTFFSIAGLLFNNCDISGWEKKDILMTIELSYSLTNNISKRHNILERGDIRKDILKKMKPILKDNYTNLLYCYAGDISFTEFEEKILFELNN